MSTLKWCDKNEVVWEETCEPKRLIIYKKDEKGNLITDKTGKYAVEVDKNGKMKHKIYNKRVHIYKGFPSYGLERKNIPNNENDEYFIDNSCTSDTKEGK